MTDEVISYNVRVRDLNKHTDNILNTLSTLRGTHKYELIREALEEFAENHKHEIVAVVERPA
jgi:hypothetical protein